MEVLYRLNRATAIQVQDHLSGNPTYSSVRALLGVLVDKGHARVSKPEGLRNHVYEPRQPVQLARKGALNRLLNTFFDDSPSELVANLLDPSERRMSSNEIAELQRLIDAHRDKALSNANSKEDLSQ